MKKRTVRVEGKEGRRGINDDTKNIYIKKIKEHPQQKKRLLEIKK